MNPLLVSIPAWLVDVAIAVLLLEALALVAYHRLTGRGLPVREWLPNLAAGLCLMFAARSALGPEPLWPVAGWLAAAGLAHARDLARRWRRRGTAAGG